MTGKTMADHARAYRTRKAERIARMEAALQSIARPFPDGCNWEDQARACQIVAQQALNPLPALHIES